MTRAFVFLLFLLLTAAVAAPAHGADSPEGRWSGDIIRAAGRLRVEVNLWQEGERWRGTMTIPSQNATLPMDADVRGSHVMFRIVGIPGESPFIGTLAADVIDGKYMNEAGWPLMLVRVEDKGGEKKN